LATCCVGEHGETFAARAADERADIVKQRVLSESES
jgi:hypothetical protein